MKTFFFLGFFWLFPSVIFSELLIMTYQCSFPVFFELQCKALKAFCEDEYTFVVFDDAKDPEYSKAYREISEKYGAVYYRIPPSIHTYAYLPREIGESLDHPTVRNCNAVEYSLRTMGRSHNDLVFILDGDLVPVRPFSMKKTMQNSHVLSVPQSRENPNHPYNRVSYLWIGFAVLDMGALPEKDLINFNCGRVHGVSVDAGGYMHLYLKKYENILHVQEVGSGIITEEICKVRPEFSPLLSWNMEDIMNGHFLHYRAGSNWDYKSPEYHQKKLEVFKKTVEEQIARSNISASSYVY